MQCKLKTKCPLRANPPELINCWREDCDGYIHGSCCKLLLDRYSIPVLDRPTLEDQDGASEPIVFCTNTCYLKWFAEKKRKAKELKKAAETEVKKRKVPWEDDGTLTALMEWITTEGNYSSYTGSNGNVKGKSKAQFHKEISLFIKGRKPDSDREQKMLRTRL